MFRLEEILIAKVTGKRLCPFRGFVCKTNDEFYSILVSLIKAQGTKYTVVVDNDHRDRLLLTIPLAAGYNFAVGSLIMFNYSVNGNNVLLELKSINYDCLYPLVKVLENIYTSSIEELTRDYYNSGYWPLERHGALIKGDLIVLIAAIQNAPNKTGTAFREMLRRLKERKPYIQKITCETYANRCSFLRVHFSNSLFSRLYLSLKMKVL